MHNNSPLVLPLQIQKKNILPLSSINLNYKTFLSLLNPDTPLASGMVNGNLIIENPYGATGILADYEINGLEVMQHPLGNLTLKASSRTSDTYDFNLALKRWWSGHRFKWGLCSCRNRCQSEP